jgi:hypothetical protein
LLKIPLDAIIARAGGMMAIRISREIYELMEQEAKGKGITPIDLITQIVEETLGRESKPAKKSPAPKRTSRQRARKPRQTRVLKK